jgi:hypothetical protein
MNRGLRQALTLYEQHHNSAVYPSRFSWVHHHGFAIIFEETFSCGTIASRLQEYINDFAILINRTPKVVLFAIDLYEDFINEECVAITAVFPFQALYIFGTELDAPQPDGFVADDDSSLGQARRSSMSR